MSPKIKYWIFLLAVAFAVFTVILASFTASWFHLSGEEREVVRDLAHKLIPFPLMGAVFLFMILGGLVSFLFNNYILPILRLGEEIKLISVANPEHRIEPRGARELILLTSIINDMAEAVQRLRTEIREQIRQAKGQLKEERNRLAALMSQLPGGVLVCNTDGQVLLYNVQAQKLLQRPGRLIGLGRSIFNVFDREPIIHALGLLQQGAAQNIGTPTTHFRTSLPDGLSIRVSMAPVFAEGEGMEGRVISGFVLAVENMSQQVEAELQRDLMFQTLTEAMDFSVGEIRHAISAILADPRMPPETLNDYRLTIDRASRAIEDQVQVARKDHTRQLFVRTKAENVLGDYLLELVGRHLAERLKFQVETRTDPDLWLQVNSVAMVQGIAQLGENLKGAGIQALSLDLTLSSEQKACLKIAWPGCRLVQGMMQDWERRPLVQDAQNRLITFHDLVEEYGGEMSVIPGSEDQCESLGLVLPLAQPERHWQDPSRGRQRPIYYEFDLFKQPGREELGRVPLNRLTFVVFDTETTGLQPAEGDEIIQIGAIRIVNGRILYDEIMDQLVDPRRPIPLASVEIHGISPELLAGQPTIEKILPSFHHFAEGSVLVAHNAAFDMRFLRKNEVRAGVRFDHPVIDTLLLSSVVHPHQEKHSLDEVARRFQVPIVGRHTALGDAIVTAEILVRLIPLLEAGGIRTLEDAIEASAASPFAKMHF